MACDSIEKSASKLPEVVENVISEVSCPLNQAVELVKTCVAGNAASGISTSAHLRAPKPHINHYPSAVNLLLFRS